MQRLQLLCLFCLLTGAVSGQTPFIDSLEADLRKYTNEDSLRLNKLIFLTTALPRKEFNKRIATADEAIALAKKLGYPSKLGLAYLHKAIVYSDHNERGDQENFMEQLRLSLPNYEKAGDLSGQGRVLRAIGIGLVNTGNYTESLIEFEKALKIFEQTGEKHRKADVLNSMGGSYFQLTLYSSAIENYLAAMTIYEEEKDSLNIAIVMVNIGLLDKYLGIYDEALGYYNRALSIYQRMNDKKMEARTLDQIGNAYTDSGLVRKALGYYRQALVINKEINEEWGFTSNYANMGIAYTGINQYDSAIEYLSMALPLMRKYGDSASVATILANLGSAIVKAPVGIIEKEGIREEDRFQLAEKHLSGALAIKERAGDIFGQVTCWEGLAALYRKEKNYPDAILAMEKIISLKDSMYSYKKSIAIAKNEMQFEQGKKDAVIAAQHAAELNHQKTVRSFWIGGAILILLAAGLLFIAYKRRRDALTKKSQAEAKAQIVETEMKVMRLQMNPHFIFNCLNSIGDYMARNDPREADAFLIKFSKLMRMTLEHSEKQAIPLHEDLEALELYMQLEAKRLNNKFSYRIQVAGDIDPANTLVPPMIFQPFVENSIWHGIARKEGKGNIDIDIRREGDMLHCRIDDDGIGRQLAAAMPVNEKTKKESLGMKITRARIAVLNKLKGTHASVYLVDKPQGVTAELRLPAETIF